MTTEPLRLRGHPGFRLFWAASTISDFGTYITTLAIGVLIVIDLGGSAADVGWINAARWAPYLVVGLLVGVLADRMRRKPLLISTDLARAFVLGAVPLLAVTDNLSVVVLAVLMAAFGLLSVCNDAAHQSFLPRLLPRAALLEPTSASSRATPSRKPLVRCSRADWLPGSGPRWPCWPTPSPICSPVC